MTKISLERITSIEAKKHDLAEAMSASDLSPDEFVRLSKEYAQVEPVATKVTSGSSSRIRAASAVVSSLTSTRARAIEAARSSTS